MNVVIKVSSPYLCLEKNGILQAFALWPNSQWIKGESLILGVRTSEHRAITRGQGEENQGVFLGVSGGQALESVMKVEDVEIDFLAMTHSCMHLRKCSCLP